MSQAVTGYLPSFLYYLDYRKLNDVTKEDCFPLPWIDSTLDTLAGTKWFSAVDLKNGNWQVNLHPDDKEKTAFSRGQGLWQVHGHALWPLHRSSDV